jgi:hypothetical protein
VPWSCERQLLSAGQPPRMVAVPTHFIKMVLAWQRGALQAVRGNDALLDAFLIAKAPVRASCPNGILVSERAAACRAW